MWGGGGQGGCESRIEVFLENKKKLGGGRVGPWGSGLGVRMDVNEELKFCENQKKKIFGGEQGSGWGVRVDVNEELKFL